MSILFNEIMFADGQNEDENEAFDLYADIKGSARISELVDDLQENDWDDLDDFETMG
jgi:hypothetical protein